MIFRHCCIKNRDALFTSQKMDRIIFFLNTTCALVKESEKKGTKKKSPTTADNKSLQN